MKSSICLFIIVVAFACSKNFKSSSNQKVNRSQEEHQIVRKSPNNVQKIVNKTINHYTNDTTLLTKIINQLKQPHSFDGIPDSLIIVYLTDLNFRDPLKNQSKLNLGTYKCYLSSRSQKVQFISSKTENKIYFYDRRNDVLLIRVFNFNKDYLGSLLPTSDEIYYCGLCAMNIFSVTALSRELQPIYNIRYIHGDCGFNDEKAHLEYCMLHVSKNISPDSSAILENSNFIINDSTRITDINGYHRKILNNKIIEVMSPIVNENTFYGLGQKGCVYYKRKNGKLYWGNGRF